MTIVTINDTYLTNIAEAIREMSNNTLVLRPKDMPDAIRDINTIDELYDGTCLTLKIKAEETSFTKDYILSQGNSQLLPIIDEIAVEAGSNLTELAAGFAWSEVEKVDLSNATNLSFIGVAVPGSTLGGNLSSRQHYDSAMFIGCPNLTKITLPPYVKEIGKRMCDQCTNLTTVEFPEDMYWIHNDAFRNTAFKKVVIPFTNSIHLGYSTLLNYDENVDDGGVFAGNSNLETVVIQADTAKIYPTAFENCPNLTNIYVAWGPGDVSDAPWGATNAEIHYWATDPAATVLEIPEGTTVIGTGDYANRYEDVVIIPSTVTTIQAEAFADCPNLKVIYSYGTSNLKTVSSTAFKGCPLRKFYMDENWEMSIFNTFPWGSTNGAATSSAYIGLE